MPERDAEIVALKATIYDLEMQIRKLEENDSAKELIESRVKQNFDWLVRHCDSLLSITTKLQSCLQNGNISHIVSCFEHVKGRFFLCESSYDDWWENYLILEELKKLKKKGKQDA